MLRAEIGPEPQARWGLGAFAVLGMSALDVLLALASCAEGATRELVAAALVLGPLHLLWVVVFGRLMRQVDLYDDALVIVGLLSRRRIAFSDVRSIDHHPKLVIGTPAGDVVVRLFTGDQEAIAAQKLREACPSAITPGRRWRAATLPVVVDRTRSSRAFDLGAVLVVGGGGALAAFGSVVAAVEQVAANEPRDAAFIVFAGLCVAGLGAFVGWAFLRFPLGWEFGPEAILARYPLRVDRRPVAGLRTAKLVSMNRATRGVARMGVALELGFDDGPMVVDLSEAGFLQSDSAARDRLLLMDLASALGHHYPNVKVEGS